MPSKSFPRKRLGGVIIVVSALFFLLQKTGLLTFSPTVATGGGLAAVFAIGLIASVSSCAAMVGGLIVAVSAAAAKRTETSGAGFHARFRPHLLFNAGRVIGFAGFGALMGLIGRAFTPSPVANGLLILAVAALMIALGMNLLDLWPAALLPRPPKWLAHRILDLEESPKPGVPFLLGALTFFLPCGFTQSMQLLALSTGDPARASLIMTVFALGTLPALLGIGAAASASRGRRTGRLTQAAGIVVVVLGLSNILNGATLLGVNVASARAPSSSAPPPSVAGGVQTVQMEVSGGGYQPDVLRVKAGVPVQWQVYGDNDMGCATSLVLGAFGIRRALQPGMNEIDFTPDRPGSYVFSCSMGMVRGTMIVE